MTEPVSLEEYKLLGPDSTPGEETAYEVGYKDGIYRGGIDSSLKHGELMAQVRVLRNALQRTREYVGERRLPATDGWDWYEAARATGGLAGFGRCACVLDPTVFGRGSTGGLKFCMFDADHEGDHGLPKRRMMAVGVEGDLFNEHPENADCVRAGCVPRA